MRPSVGLGFTLSPCLYTKIVCQSESDQSKYGESVHVETNLGQGITQRLINGRSLHMPVAVGARALRPGCMGNIPAGSWSQLRGRTLMNGAWWVIGGGEVWIYGGAVQSTINGTDVGENKGRTCSRVPTRSHRIP